MFSIAPNKMNINNCENQDFLACGNSAFNLFQSQHEANVLCCVFRPAFGCWAHPKAGRNLFSAVFQPY